MQENRELDERLKGQSGLKPANEELTSKLQAKNRELIVQNGILTQQLKESTNLVAKLKDITAKLEDSKRRTSSDSKEFYKVQSEKYQLEVKVAKLETELATQIARAKKDQDQASIYEHHSYNEEL